MKLHAHANYALQILQHIHEHPDSLHSATRIIESIGGSHHAFSIVINRLNIKGLVRVVQGRGGYQLGRPAHEISVYDVFSCIEGDKLVQRLPRTDGGYAHSKMNCPIFGVHERFFADMSNPSIAELTLDRLIECSGRLYRVETRDKTYMIPFDEIILIRSGSTKGTLELHRKHDRLEFRGMISRIAIGVPELFHCHMSFVVNIKHVKHIDETKRELELIDGRLVPIAKRKIRTLNHLMEAAS